MHPCMSICLCIYVYACGRMCAHAFMYVYVHVHVCVCACVCEYAYVRVCICMCMCRCMFVICKVGTESSLTRMMHLTVMTHQLHLLQECCRRLYTCDTVHAYGINVNMHTLHLHSLIFCMLHWTLSFFLSL